MPLTSPYLRPATIEDAEVISEFLVKTIRHSFTKDIILGPQEYFKSKKFEEDYLDNAKSIIENPENVTLIAIKKEEEKEEEEEEEEKSGYHRLQVGDILGYAALGPRKKYFQEYPISHEILCLFMRPTLKQKGQGSLMLIHLLDKMIQDGRFHLDTDTIGVMTLQRNPSIAFYEKMGSRHIADIDFSFKEDAIPTTLLQFDVQGVRTLLERGHRKHLS